VIFEYPGCVFCTSHVASIYLPSRVLQGGMEICRRGQSNGDVCVALSLGRRQSRSNSTRVGRDVIARQVIRRLAHRLHSIGRNGIDGDGIRRIRPKKRRPKK